MNKSLEVWRSGGLESVEAETICYRFKVWGGYIYKQGKQVTGEGGGGQGEQHQNRQRQEEHAVVEGQDLKQNQGKHGERQEVQNLQSHTPTSLVFF